MKKFTTLFALAAILFSACCGKTDSTSDPIVDSFNEVSKSVKSVLAPDRRDNTYEVKIEKVGSDYVLYGSTSVPEAKEALLNDLKEKNITVKDSIVLLPDPALGDKIWGIVSSSVACLRYGASYSAEMASQVLMGTPLEILEKKSYWLRVNTPEGYHAWVTEGSVQRMNEEELKAWKSSKRMILTTHLSIFRSEPSPKADVISDGAWGGIVEYLGKEGNYYRIKLPRGNRVYVPCDEAEFLTPWLASRNPTPGNILKQARQFMGFPYLWGGTSPKSMDCSGFTKVSYFLNGIILRRDASQQSITGVNIPYTSKFEELQAGDLLFFGSKATETKKERITHVGIYMQKGNFIHCATNVKINSLFPESTYYYPASNNLVRVQRILGNQDKMFGITSIIKHPWYFNL